MSRFKLPVRLISDRRRRNATFMKRQVGLKKKAKELATLCDVSTLIVCFGPEGQVEVWPEDRGKAYAVIDRFNSSSAEGRGKHRYDVSSFFGDAVTKQAREEDLQYCSEEQLLRMVPESSLEELERGLEARLKAIEERMRALRGEAALQGGEQGAEGWQQTEQGQLHYYLLGTNPAGEETLDMDGYWGNPNGGIDVDASAVLEGFRQNMVQPFVHGGAAPAPPPAYSSASFTGPFLQTHGDNTGLMSCLGASMACNPHLFAAPAAGYPYYPDGFSAQSYLHEPSTSTSPSAPATATSFMPPRHSSAFLDNNGAGGSAMRLMTCCCASCTAVMPREVGLLGAAGGGAREQVAGSSSGSNGDAVHHWGQVYGDGVGLLQDDPVEEGDLGNPWGSVYPAHPSGTIAATPLAVDDRWTGFVGSW